MAGFLASSELSPSPEQMEFHGNFLSKWNFSGISFGGLLARITEYLLNGSLREVKFHMVQYYRDMWQKRSEMLAPLTILVGGRETKTTKKNKTKKLPWRWESIHQQAFDNVKATIAKEVVLAYPDFTMPFEIYTDASTMQLGAVITQGNRPIVFFIRKLSVMQTKYSFTKIKLFAIVETLKEF
jgi:hypothetical protein